LRFGGSGFGQGFDCSGTGQLCGKCRADQVGLVCSRAIWARECSGVLAMQSVRKAGFAPFLSSQIALARNAPGSGAVNSTDGFNV